MVENDKSIKCTKFRKIDQNVDYVSMWCGRRLVLGWARTSWNIQWETRILRSSSLNAKKIDSLSLRIGDDVIQQSSKIRNLGVILDTTLSMSDHVRTIVKNVNFHLRSIYRIRRYITVESWHHLVRALILSRLNYANSLMLGISAKDRNQLQKLRNRAARIVFRAERLHPSAPLLITLHWLPVDQRIKFKGGGLVLSKCKILFYHQNWENSTV